MKLRILALALTLAACGNQPAGNAMTSAAVVDEPTPAACPFPKLDFRAADELSAADRAKFTNNLRVAIDKACAEGLFADEPLIDPRSEDKQTLFVLHSPEANVTSIYFAPSGAPPSMLLESPFGDPPQVPSVEDLHEAIYCVMKGATPEEEERDGRCLPD